MCQVLFNSVLSVIKAGIGVAMMNPDERLDSERLDSEQGNRFPDLARFGFVLCARDPIRLPEFAGSAWRGLLGHGLRRTACVTRQPTCTGCLLIHSCAYSLIFETPPPPGQDLTGFTALDHPYALDIDPRAPRHYQPGEHLVLGLTLIGPTIAQAPYLIHAMTQAGQLGFGREGGGSGCWHCIGRPGSGAATGNWSTRATMVSIARYQRPPSTCRPPPRGSACRC